MTDGNWLDMLPDAAIVLLIIGLLWLVFGNFKKK